MSEKVLKRFDERLAEVKRQGKKPSVLKFLEARRTGIELKKPLSDGVQTSKKYPRGRGTRSN